MRPNELETIFIVEDDEGLAELERQRLERAGYRTVWAGTAADALHLLATEKPALMLLDYRLPGNVDGLDLFDRIKALGHDLPIILVTGFSDEATVIRAMRSGVRDYVTKSLEYLDYLPEAVEKVLRQVRVERQLTESEQRFRSMADCAPMIIWLSEVDGSCSFLNQRWVQFTGRRQEEGLGEGCLSSLHPDDHAATIAAYRAAFGQRQPFTMEYRLRRSDGEYRWIMDSGTPRYFPDGTFAGYIGSAVDITDRKRTEDRLREQATLLDQARDAILVTDLEDRIQYWNRGAEVLYGWTREQALGQNAAHFLQVSAAESEETRRAILETGEWIGEMRQAARDGAELIVESHHTLLSDHKGHPRARLLINTDITEKKRLEARFLQAQKMESIGMLAGGIAHDFNNLLTIINGYSDLLLLGIVPSEETGTLLQEIKKAGDKAAGLTRQLLAFSRKQLLQPVVLDLNELIRELEKLLRRLIGEDIDLACVLAPNLGCVKADPGQMEQVLINLAVNSRDAMPRGGHLTIETRNVRLDEEEVKQHTGLRPGPYVRLAVTDTGSGMTEEVKARIFEPFFSTKEPGRGTGLGLATVYGIVKQSGGHISAYSEVGNGTTFQIYLPRLADTASPSASAPVPMQAPQGTETLLLAEDEEGVRSLTRMALQSLGYTVLEAGNGQEALTQCQQHTGPIPLLLTDVVMPGMGGRELAGHAQRLRPEMKVLYLSGYTDDAIVRHGVLEADMAFLHKPFTPMVLARRVREILDTPRSPGGR